MRTWLHQVSKGKAARDAAAAEAVLLVHLWACISCTFGTLGRIPTEIGQLVQLKQIGMRNNHLTGACSKFALLDQHDDWENDLSRKSFANLAAGCILACVLGPGPIPREIGRLVQLTDIWLQNNQLTGAILVAHLL